MSKSHPKRITVAEINQDRFYKMPKELFTSDLYKELNSDARVLYAMLADRKELSRDNNWVDENKDIYLNYSRKSLAELIGVSVNTVTKAFKLLVKCRLIDDVRQGLNKSNRIYVLKVDYTVDNKGISERSTQDSNGLHTNETEPNETEKIKRYIITETSNEVLSYYYDKYKEILKKEHPSVTEQQLEDMEEVISYYEYKEEDYHEHIDEYFKFLPDSNDGKAMAYFNDRGAIQRYIR